MAQPPVTSFTLSESATQTLATALCEYELMARSGKDFRGGVIDNPEALTNAGKLAALARLFCDGCCLSVTIFKAPEEY